MSPDTRLGRPTAVAIAFLLGCGFVLSGCAESQLALEPRLDPSFSAAPVVITFDKKFKEAASTETLLVWHGTVQANGMTGKLVSSIDLTTPGTRLTGNDRVLHATVRWVATGDVEFEIVTSGIVNLVNGAVRTNGRGISGLGAGAAVHQEGQLTDGLDAAGLLRLNPASAR